MKIIRDLEVWRAWRAGSAFASKTVGLVPTMGALHAGHIALMERCRAECDTVVLSIFVNPTQFNNTRDLDSYPNTFSRDQAIAEQVGMDCILAPSYRALYPDDFRYKVMEKELANMLCGAHRPGHFTGVLTVVMKLFNLVRPHKAYLGEKDFQQLQLVKGMIEAFFLDVELVPCSTVRDNDGLALSSRNINLSPEARRLAAAFPRILRASETVGAARDALAMAGLDVDYVEDHDGRRYGAVHCGGVRLIDNFAQKQQGPPKTAFQSE